MLFWNWLALEVGIGAIACNLPSLSFRMASALPRAINNGWVAARTRIQNAITEGREELQNLTTMRNERTKETHSIELAEPPKIHLSAYQSATSHCSMV
jgi:hypothetical protein